MDGTRIWHGNRCTGINPHSRALWILSQTICVGSLPSYLQTSDKQIFSVHHGNCPKLPQNTARVPNGMRGLRDRLLSFWFLGIGPESPKEHIWFIVSFMDGFFPRILSKIVVGIEIQTYPSNSNLPIRWIARVTAESPMSSDWKGYAL